MKPHRRALLTTPTFRAIYAKGKAAAIEGKPRQCPYSPADHAAKIRMTWFAGWDDGDREMQRAATMTAEAC